MISDAHGAKNLRGSTLQPQGLEEQVTENDVVTMIAACLYASRATDDALRAEPDIAVLADEAWNVYHKLRRAVAVSPRSQGGDEGTPIGRG